MIIVNAIFSVLTIALAFVLYTLYRDAKELNKLWEREYKDSTGGE